MKNTVIYCALIVLGLAAGIGIGTMRAMEGTEANRIAAQQPTPTREPVSLPEGHVRKRVGLVAHDACKGALLAWVDKNAPLLAEQELFCTGTTGRLVTETLTAAMPGKDIALTRFNSGPLGGDMQMGALAAQGGLDVLVFFVDPMSAHPHDADISALLRMCRVHNVVLATTPSTADFVIASPYFTGSYAIQKTDHSSYVNRQVK